MNEITQVSSMRPFTGTRKNGGIHYTSKTPIPLDMIGRIAPAVFAPDKHESRSARYTYTPSRDVISHLMENGFQVYAVAQSGSRDVGRRAFTKYLLRLRRGTATGTTQVGDREAEVIYTNAHDGTGSAVLMAGIINWLCLNGCIASEGLVESIRVPHSKADAKALVLDGCIELLSRLPVVDGSIRDMEKIMLTNGEQTAFATAGIVARYGNDVAPVTPAQVLAPRRYGDNSPSLWHTFNRVQESLVRGGIGYDSTLTRADGRVVPVRRTTREIHSVDGNVGVNRALWTLAEEMKKLKADGQTGVVLGQN
jgi:hypothetical protein